MEPGIYFVVFSNGTILYFGKEESVANTFYNNGYATIKVTSLEELNIAYAMSEQFDKKISTDSTTLSPAKTEIPSFEEIVKLINVNLETLMKGINKYAPMLSDLKNVANKIFKK